MDQNDRIPASRSEAIARIDSTGKREEFIETFERTPEAYFEEYAYLEPDIWTNVLNDLKEG